MCGSVWFGPPRTGGQVRVLYESSAGGLYAGDSGKYPEPESANVYALFDYPVLFYHMDMGGFFAKQGAHSL